MNNTVNAHPPPQFTIFYNSKDAALQGFLYRDVIGDVSHLAGGLFVIVAWIGSVLVVLLVERESKKARRSAEQPAMEGSALNREKSSV